MPREGRATVSAPPGSARSWSGMAVSEKVNGLLPIRALMLSWRPPSHLMMPGVVVRAATSLG